MLKDGKFLCLYARRDVWCPPIGVIVCIRVIIKFFIF